MSPIQGLTDAPRAFIRVGRIKKGIKDPESGAMKDLDYFRTVFDPSAQDIADEFLKIYGPKPTRINIRLAFRTVAEVWDANYECYKTGGMIAKAGSNENGPYWIYYRHPETSKVLVRNGRPVGPNGEAFMAKPLNLAMPIYSYMGSVKQEDGTKKKQSIPVYLEPAGRLNVVVPEIAHLRVGFMEFCPGSPSDIRTISAELGAIDLWARNVGKDITGIPMVLTRREEMVTKNINGVLSRGKSWVVHIEVDGQWGDKALESFQMKSLPDNVVDGEFVEDEEQVPHQIPAHASVPGNQPAVVQAGGWEPPFPEEEPEQKPDPKPASKEKVPAPATQATSNASAGSQPAPSRPWPPEIFKAKLLEAARMMPEVYEKKKLKLEVSETEAKVLASALDGIFGDKGISRHIACAWLVGTGSTKEMTPATVKAFFHVMGIKNTLEHPANYNDPPSPVSMEELRAVLPFAETEINKVKA